MRPTLFFLALYLSQLVHAATLGSLNPYRSPGTSYTQYRDRMLQQISEAGRGVYETPLSAARYYSSTGEANLPVAREWNTQSNLRKRFTSIRDTRFLTWQRQPEFLRRISWLYPIDGC